MGPVIRVPSSAFHWLDGSGGALGDHRSHQQIVAHQELVFDVLVAAVGKYVGKRAHDRFAGGGSGLGEFEDARCEPHPQRHGLFDGSQMGGVQYAPVRDGR